MEEKCACPYADCSPSRRSSPRSAAGAGTARADGPTVVELFTSQGCYSCPPAERFLGDLADRDGILALEFHVDYWDNLNYGSAGK